MTVSPKHIKDFKDAMESIVNDVQKTDDEKFIEVCITYAQIIVVFSDNQNQLTLEQLQPITNIFKNHFEQLAN